MTLGQDEKVVLIGFNFSAFDKSIQTDSRLFFLKADKAAGYQLPPKTASIVINSRISSQCLDAARELAAGTPTFYAKTVAETIEKLDKLLGRAARPDPPPRNDTQPAANPQLAGVNQGFDLDSAAEVGQPGGVPTQNPLPNPDQAEGWVDMPIREFVRLHFEKWPEFSDYGCASRIADLASKLGHRSTPQAFYSDVRKMRGNPLPKRGAGGTSGKKAAPELCKLDPNLTMRLRSLSQMHDSAARELEELLPQVEAALSAGSRTAELEDEINRLRAENAQLKARLERQRITIQRTLTEFVSPAEPENRPVP